MNSSTCLLFNAISHNDIGGTLDLIRRDPHLLWVALTIEKKNYNVGTLCARFGRLDLLESLVQEEPDFDPFQRDQQGNSILQTAARFGQEAVVRWCLNRGLQPDALTIKEQLPARSLALANGHLLVAELLDEVTSNRNGLPWALAHSRTSRDDLTTQEINSVWQRYIELGALEPPQGLPPPSSPLADGNLHKLIQQKIPLEPWLKVLSFGEKDVDCAIRFENEDALRALIEKGARPFAPVRTGRLSARAWFAAELYTWVSIKPLLWDCAGFL